MLLGEGRGWPVPGRLVRHGDGVTLADWLLQGLLDCGARDEIRVRRFLINHNNGKYIL